jgi:hypothetical protein
MALQKNRCAKGAAVGRAHSDEKHWSFPAPELTQFHEFGTNFRIAAIGLNQLAKPAWLLPAFDLHNLDAGCGEQRGWRLNSSDPPRSILLRFFHDRVFPTS